MENNGLIKPESIYSLKVAIDQKPKRIDSFLANHFSHYSRTFFAQLIDKNLVTLNGIITQKQSTIVKPDDVVTITFPPQFNSVVTADDVRDLDIPIIHTHEHFFVISKPAHLIVHKPTATSLSITLTDWLLATHANLSSVGCSQRPGIVHRLDKDTSGLMIIARTNYAHTIFGNLFKERAIQKSYLAVVRGSPERSGTITLAIGRDPFTRNKMTTFAQHVSTENSSKGIRTARSDYTVLEYFDTAALIHIQPLTGRTHQIRVHCAAIGHPIIGDALYGKTSPLITRQALHAYTLSFTFDNQFFSFTQPLPEDFNKLLSTLRAY